MAKPISANVEEYQLAADCEPSFRVSLDAFNCLRLWVKVFEIGGEDPRGAEELRRDLFGAL